MKKIISFLLALCLCLGTTSTVFAADSGLVRVDNDGNVQVSDFDLEEFRGMAPGDIRTEKILIRNDYDKDMNFYVTLDTIESLERTNEAAGGSYEFDMSVGKQYDAAVSLLKKATGGYDSSGNASSTGLEEIDELSEEGEFLVRLAPGEETGLFLTLEIYGEGNDREGYANAVGQLSFTFAAKQAYDNPTILKRIHNIVTTNPISKYVMTGDNASYVIFAGVLLAGVVVIIVSIISMRNRKRRKIHEEI